MFINSNCPVAHGVKKKYLYWWCGCLKPLHALCKLHRDKGGCQGGTGTLIYSTPLPGDGTGVVLPRLIHRGCLRKYFNSGLEAASKLREKYCNVCQEHLIGQQLHVKPPVSWHWAPQMLCFLGNLIAVGWKDNVMKAWTNSLILS